MATNSHNSVGAARRLSQALLLVLAAAVMGAGQAKTLPVYHEDDDDGRDLAAQNSHRPTVEAAFPLESYGPGSVARLVITDRARAVSIQVKHVGPETGIVRGNDVMTGVPVTSKHAIGPVAGRRTVNVRLGNWPSGVYFAELTAPGGRVGYAPFVLRPRHLGEHSVAVVMPTQTWQAYNHRDDNGDGKADTWYACTCQHTARLGRPFLDRGTPPHFKYYEIPFLRWLSRNHPDVDIISDAELRRASGRQLAKAYTLLIFSGHHEYVTTHEYDAVTEFRNRGGNLMFLSANNFYWKIVIRDHVMTRMVKWRDLGRPEAALLGVEYFHNDGGEHRGDWVVRNASRFEWMLAGTGLGNGGKISNGGIEADRMTSASPRSTHVVAEIPNLYGPGMTAQMTYYEKGGAKVFAAGAFTLAGAIGQPKVARLMDNLFDRLSKP
ncbi:MAG: N,N-dimethylformamidase beta subunit family domain-containing protein [Gaiellaceae bacterium]